MIQHDRHVVMQPKIVGGGKPCAARKLQRRGKRRARTLLAEAQQARRDLEQFAVSSTKLK